MAYKAEKKKRTIEKKTILVIRDENKTALCKRPSKGLLAGMYEFPTLEGHRTAEEVIEYLKDMGLSPIRIWNLDNSKHIFTHKEWHMIGYAIRVDELERYSEGENILFVHPAKIQQEYPVPSALSAYAACL